MQEIIVNIRNRMLTMISCIPPLPKKLDTMQEVASLLGKPVS